LNYFAWEVKPGSGHCVLDELEGYEDEIYLSRGKQSSADFPDSAFFQMNKSYKKDIKLADQLKNGSRMTVVNKKVMDFLNQKKIPITEYLQVSVINHKKQVASKEYWIVNPYSVQDCIDKDKSDLVWNVIDPELISGVFKLVLKEDCIDKNLSLFRIKHYSHVVVIREDLANEIKSQGFSGTLITPINDAYIRS
jgi:hypothetical protein